MQIIDELANAMTEMYAMYVNSKLGELSGQLKNTIISNHRMEVSESAIRIFPRQSVMSVELIM